MALDENKIVNYLNDHVGELITSYELVKITEAFEGKMDEIEKSDFGLFEMNDKVAEIAKRNGFTLSTAHHKKDPGGLAWALPWNIDFKIKKRKSRK